MGINVFSKMNCLEIRRYSSSDRETWNNFIESSINGNFLFNRGFMEYHSDRVKDASLMIYDEGKLIALLPANWSEEKGISSHGALTFGGLIQNPKLKAASVLVVFDSLMEYMKKNGVERFVYKPTPSIFHQNRSEDDLYAIFRHGFSLIRRDLSSVLFLDEAYKTSSLRKRGAKKALKNGCIVKRSDDYEGFFQILNERLGDKYGVSATHSLEEMLLLKERFEEEIKLFIVCSEKIKILAGVIVFDFGPVDHCQYICSSDAGRSMGALDLLMQELISRAKEQGKRSFSFGSSVEDQGRLLNEGLLAQKEGFGARSITLDFYEKKF